jgi:hypothetical protein
MPTRTVPLTDLTAVIRRPFTTRTDAAGNPVPDPRTGEMVHTAEAVVAGLLPSPYATDDTPGVVRVKVVGGHCPDHALGARVLLAGATLTAWYTPRGRGGDANSATTIRATAVTATDAPATLRGGLAAHLDGAGAMLLAITEDRADVLVDPVGVFTVDSLLEVRTTVPPPAHLIGDRVDLVGFRAFHTQPDRADVGRNVKAAVILACSTIAAAAVSLATSNGRRRAADPEPVE